MYTYKTTVQKIRETDFQATGMSDSTDTILPESNKKYVSIFYLYDDGNMLAGEHLYDLWGDRHYNIKVF